MTRRLLCLATTVVLAVTWAVYRAQARADEAVADREEHDLWL